MLVATYVVPGIKFDRWQDLLVATLVLGLLNSFLRPLLMLLSLPLLIFTLGLVHHRDQCRAAAARQRVAGHVIS